MSGSLNPMINLFGFKSIKNVVSIVFKFTQKLKVAWLPLKLKPSKFKLSLTPSKLATPVFALSNQVVTPSFLQYPAKSSALA